MRILFVCAFVAICLTAVTANRGGFRRSPRRGSPKTCCPIPNIVSEELKEKCVNMCSQLRSPTTSAPAELEDAFDRESVEAVVDLGEADGVYQHPTVSKREKQQRHPVQRHVGHPYMKRRHSQNNHACYSSCVMHEMGIMNVTTINEPKLQQHLSVVLKDLPDFQPLIVEFFQTCTTTMANLKAKCLELKQHNHRPPRRHGRRGRWHRHQQACQPHRGTLSNCVQTQIFHNCPASVWNNSKQCNDWRQLTWNWKPIWSGNQRWVGHGPHGERDVHRQFSEENTITSDHEEEHLKVD